MPARAAAKGVSMPHLELQKEINRLLDTIAQQAPATKGNVEQVKTMLDKLVKMVRH